MSWKSWLCIYVVVLVVGLYAILLAVDGVAQWRGDRVYIMPPNFEAVAIDAIRASLVILAGAGIYGGVIKVISDLKGGGKNDRS